MKTTGDNTQECISTTEISDEEQIKNCKSFSQREIKEDQIYFRESDIQIRE